MRALAVETSAPLLDAQRIMIEIADSEAALADTFTRAERMHRARIEHDPVSCLVCFASR